MLRHVLSILAAAVLVGCSKAPGTVRAAGHVKPDTPQQQLAAFQLQTACAHEARAWLNERERNEGYNPNAGSGGQFTVDLGKTHYSLVRRGCYAVVDEQTTVVTGRVFAFSDSRSLYQVDGDMEPVAQLSGATSDPTEALIGGAVLVRDVKSCVVGVQKCDSLAMWQTLTRSYLEQ